MDDFARPGRLARGSFRALFGPHFVLDGAGWHQSGLRLPTNISLLNLPPYCPELNPVENVWEFLTGNQLGNRSMTLTRRSSTPVASHETPLSQTQYVSAPLPNANGHRSKSDTANITTTPRDAIRTCLHCAQKG